MNYWTLESKIRSCPLCLGAIHSQSNGHYRSISCCRVNHFRITDYNDGTMTVQWGEVLTAEQGKVILSIIYPLLDKYSYKDLYRVINEKVSRLMVIK
jgi:hypothetical protein